MQSLLTKGYYGIEALYDCDALQAAACLLYNRCFVSLHLVVFAICIAWVLSAPNMDLGDHAAAFWQQQEAHLNIKPRLLQRIHAVIPCASAQLMLLQYMVIL
jgi:hypothetical protein